MTEREMDVPFDWIGRCGRHLAYHASPANRLIHAVLIPLELSGAIALLRLLPLPFLNNADGGVMGAIAVGALCVRCEPVAGAMYTLLLLGLVKSSLYCDCF